MFPVCLEATEMDSGGEHKRNWHALANYISLVARDLCICDLGVMLRNQGTVGSRPPWGCLGERGRAELQKWGLLRVDDWVGLSVRSCSLRQGWKGESGGKEKTPPPPSPPPTRCSPHTRGIACALGTWWTGLLLGERAG